MMTKRWGSEEVLFSGPYLVKRLVLHDQHETSMHFHYAKCETIYVLEGTLYIEYDDGRKIVLRKDEHVTIREGKVNAHRMSAPKGDVVYIESSTPHECDSERIRL